MAAAIIPVLTDRRHLSAADHADLILGHQPKEIFRHVQLCPADRQRQLAAVFALEDLCDDLRAALEKAEAAREIYARAYERANRRDQTLNS